MERRAVLVPGDAVCGFKTPESAEVCRRDFRIRKCLFHSWCMVVSLASLASAPTAGHAAPFNFRTALFGPPQSLSLHVESVNATNGLVLITGVDTRQPSTPFTWQWGDGSVTSGFFPQSHTYTNRMTNCVVSVIAFYSGGRTGFAQTVVWLTSPRIEAVSLPADTWVNVAVCPQTLGSRQPGYGFSQQLTNFAGTNFGPVPQTTIEYVLSAAAAMERDFANENFFRPDGQFNQVVMGDLSGGLYSLWYATPVAFAAGKTFTGSVPWSSCFHEMGHNFTLNSPASYYYGGKIDGNANAIISEALAEMFQHATAYELINHSAELGLSAELVADIRNSASSSMAMVVSAFNDYTNHGSAFQSWNNPSTPQDETFDTFMTVALRFFVHAEQGQQGYRIPLKRLMQALELFNSNWLGSYDPSRDSLVAGSFRATLWVAALSYAFQSDLRREFASLGFPVSDATYQELHAQMAALPDLINVRPRLGITVASDFSLNISVNGPARRFYAIERAVRLSPADWAPWATFFAVGTNYSLAGAATNEAQFYRSVLLP
jgi:hypothetical protein